MNLTWWDFVIVAGVLLALYALACSRLYRGLFLPDRRSWEEDFRFTPFEFQAEAEEVELESADGVRYGAWFLRQPGHPQVIVVSPGQRGRRQDVIGISVALWRKGFNVLCYSYRGMAGSEGGQPTWGAREVQELGAALAWVRRRVLGARIGLLGYSVGAAVSLLAAAGDPAIEALVLDSPYADLTRQLKERARRATGLPGAVLLAPVALWLRLRTGARLGEASPISVLSGLEPRPLFFIHGGADRVTDVRHSRDLYDSYRGPREIWVVQGAPHLGAYFDDRPSYVERVAGFFGRHLGMSQKAVLRLVDDEEVS